MVSIHKSDRSSTYLYSYQFSQRKYVICSRTTFDRRILSETPSIVNFSYSLLVIVIVLLFTNNYFAAPLKPQFFFWPCNLVGGGRLTFFNLCAWGITVIVRLLP